jgi:hypothetical protein
MVHLVLFLRIHVVRETTCCESNAGELENQSLKVGGGMDVFATKHSKMALSSPTRKRSGAQVTKLN